MNRVELLATISEALEGTDADQATLLVKINRGLDSAYPDLNAAQNALLMRGEFSHAEAAKLGSAMSGTEQPPATPTPTPTPTSATPDVQSQADNTASAANTAAPTAQENLVSLIIKTREEGTEQDMERLLNTANTKLDTEFVDSGALEAYVNMNADKAEYSAIITEFETPASTSTSSVPKGAITNPFLKINGDEDDFKPFAPEDKAKVLAAKDNAAITSIAISNSDIDRDTVRELIDAGAFKNATHLFLDNNKSGSTPMVFDYFSGLATNAKNLVHISLKGADLTSSHVGYIDRLENISSINLERTKLKPGQLKQLFVVNVTDAVLVSGLKKDTVLYLDNVSVEGGLNKDDLEALQILAKAEVKIEGIDIPALENRLKGKETLPPKGIQQEKNKNIVNDLTTAYQYATVGADAEKAKGIENLQRFVKENREALKPHIDELKNKIDDANLFPYLANGTENLLSSIGKSGAKLKGAAAVPAQGAQQGSGQNGQSGTNNTTSATPPSSSSVQPANPATSAGGNGRQPNVVNDGLSNLNSNTGAGTGTEKQYSGTHTPRKLRYDYYGQNAKGSESEYIRDGLRKLGVTTEAKGSPISRSEVQQAAERGLVDKRENNNYRISVAKLEVQLQSATGADSAVPKAIPVAQTSASNLGGGFLAGDGSKKGDPLITPTANQLKVLKDLDIDGWGVGRRENKVVTKEELQAAVKAKPELKAIFAHPEVNIDINTPIAYNVSAKNPRNSSAPAPQPAQPGHARNAQEEQGGHLTVHKLTPDQVAMVNDILRKVDKQGVFSGWFDKGAKNSVATKEEFAAIASKLSPDEKTRLANAGINTNEAYFVEPKKVEDAIKRSQQKHP